MVLSQLFLSFAVLCQKPSRKLPAKLQLLQRRLPYRLPCTTRGSHLLKINHSHSDSISHHSSYLGLTDHPHLHLIYTHTYKPLSHTDSLRSLDLPCCHFWALYPCLLSCFDLGLFPVSLIVLCLPRPWIVSHGLCFLAACPDLSPGIWLSLSSLCCSALPVFDPVLSDYS